MQLKGFFAGAAVASLVWLGSTAGDNFAAEMRSDSRQAAPGVHAAARGMTEAEKEAHVSEMRKLMDAHRNLGVCPYSGRSARGDAPRGTAPVMRQGRQPIEI